MISKELHTLLEEFKEIKEKKALFFSETHGMIAERDIQAEIIGIIKPDLFLYELLEEEELPDKESQESFLSLEDKDPFSLISTIGDLRETISLALKTNLPIKGCDYKDMLREDLSFRLLEYQENPDLEKEESIMTKREDKQKSVLLESFKSHNTIFMSVGAYHLRGNSTLRKINFPSLHIRPLFDGKEIDETEDPFHASITYIGELDYGEKN